MLNHYLEVLRKNKKGLLFIAKLIGLYSLLQGLYLFVLSPTTSIDYYIIELIIKQAEYLLEAFGYELLQPNPQYTAHMGIVGSSGVVIGNPCNGLSLFILYLSFIIVFRGNPLMKLGFIVVGTVLIHLLNVIRVLGLAIIVLYYPDSLDFHHSYTFTLLVYLFIFFLWFYRIKVYQKKKL